jgi:hypothetical protein
MNASVAILTASLHMRSHPGVSGLLLTAFVGKVGVVRRCAGRNKAIGLQPFQRTPGEFIDISGELTFNCVKKGQIGRCMRRAAFYLWKIEIVADMFLTKNP